jgi:hypothetical protein
MSVLGNTRLTRSFPVISDKARPTGNDDPPEHDRQTLPPGTKKPAGHGERMTEQERLRLSVETIELAKLAAELRQAGRQFEADRVAIRVAENSGRLARR